MKLFHIKVSILYTSHRAFEIQPSIISLVLLAVKQINRQLIAVAQFIFSVLAGFAFGFIGIELLVGDLDFGFRLLLGIICALVIALAEIYFLAKKLNEDLDYAAEQAARTTSNSKSSSQPGKSALKSQAKKEHQE